MGTILTDSVAQALDGVDAWAGSYLKSRVEKGKMTAEAVGATLASFRLEFGLAKSVADADLVIEAILSSNSSTFLPSI
jgi:3-hydroxyacyl-CoA dehydrogenase